MATRRTKAEIEVDEKLAELLKNRVARLEAAVDELRERWWRLDLAEINRELEAKDRKADLEN